MCFYTEKGGIFYISASCLGWGKKEKKSIIHEHEDHGVEDLSLPYLIIHR